MSPLESRDWRDGPLDAAETTENDDAFEVTDRRRIRSTRSSAGVEVESAMGRVDVSVVFAEASGMAVSMQMALECGTFLSLPRG